MTTPDFDPSIQPDIFTEALLKQQAVTCAKDMQQRGYFPKLLNFFTPQAIQVRQEEVRLYFCAFQEEDALPEIHSGLVLTDKPPFSSYAQLSAQMQLQNDVFLDLTLRRMLTSSGSPKVNSIIIDTTIASMDTRPQTTSFIYFLNTGAKYIGFPKPLLPLPAYSSANEISWPSWSLSLSALSLIDEEKFLKTFQHWTHNLSSDFRDLTPESAMRELSMQMMG